MLEIKVCFFRIQSATLVFRVFWHDWPCNPEIPRPTVSATVRSWIAFACIALWLRSSLIYWKQSNKGGNPEDNRAGKQEFRLQRCKIEHAILIQFPKTSPFDFVLGDWKAQKCLAGTVQGPWGLRKNDIPYSKTSAGMVKHALTLKWNTFLHKQDGSMFQCTVEWIDWVYVDLALLALPPFAKHNAATSTFAKRRLSLVLHVALPNPQRTGSALGMLCTLCPKFDSCKSLHRQRSCRL